jgi:hypothetical protein
MAGLASVANAQVCVGAPSFSVGGARVGGHALIADQSKTYGGQLALGEHKGLFLDGAFSHAKDDNSDGSSNAFSGGVGYEINTGGPNSMQLCPMVGVTGQEGSLIGNQPVAAPQNTLDWNFGASLGWVASSSSSVEVIPAVGAALVARSYKAKIVNAGAGNPSTTDSFGLITGTIGFVFNKRCTISPVVIIPVSLDNGKASYGVNVSYNFSLPKGMHM